MRTGLAQGFVQKARKRPRPAQGFFRTKALCTPLCTTRLPAQDQGLVVHKASAQDHRPRQYLVWSGDLICRGPGPANVTHLPKSSTKTQQIHIFAMGPGPSNVTRTWPTRPAHKAPAQGPHKAFAQGPAQGVLLCAIF